MGEKLKPAVQWVKERAHNDLDSEFVEIVADAVARFSLDDEEALALCERVGVQFVRVKSLRESRS